MITKLNMTAIPQRLSAYADLFEFISGNWYAGFRPFENMHTTFSFLQGIYHNKPELSFDELRAQLEPSDDESQSSGVDQYIRRQAKWKAMHRGNADPEDYALLDELDIEDPIKHNGAFYYSKIECSDGLAQGDVVNVSSNQQFDWPQTIHIYKLVKNNWSTDGAGSYTEVRATMDDLIAVLNDATDEMIERGFVGEFPLEPLRLQPSDRKTIICFMQDMTATATIKVPTNLILAYSPIAMDTLIEEKYDIIVVPVPASQHVADIFADLICKGYNGNIHKEIGKNGRDMLHFAQIIKHLEIQLGDVNTTARSDSDESE